MYLVSPGVNLWAIRISECYVMQDSDINIMIGHFLLVYYYWVPFILVLIDWKLPPCNLPSSHSAVLCLDL
jgi:hypothetical protein